VGKRYKRLTMKKYAKKYASIIETIGKLKDVVEETATDNIAAPQEIKQPAEKKQKVVDLASEIVVETIKESIPDVKEEIKSETLETTEKTKSTKKQSLKQETNKSVKKTAVKKSMSKGQNKVS